MGYIRGSATDIKSASVSRYVARQKNFQSIEPNIQIVLTIALKSTQQALYLEKLLHEEFKDSRTHGEWFKLTETNIEKIKNFQIVFSQE